MKKNRRTLSFLGGMVTAFLLCFCLTAVFAASGSVTFNEMNVSFDCMHLLKKGKPLQTNAGASIPSTILYTDEQGGGTTYVPIRTVADAFHMPINWVKDTNTVHVNVDGMLELYTLSLYVPDVSIDYFEEVTPILPNKGRELLPQQEYQSEEGFMKELPIDIDKGRYVSITVTNHFNDDKPIEFDLGHLTCVSGLARFRTQVPAGETVTRTIKVTAEEDQTIDPLYMFVGYPDGTEIDRPTDITISAIQFEK